MSSSLTVIDPGLLTVIKGGLGSSLALPFGTEIFLMECHVAGTSHLDLTDLYSELEYGSLLTFRRAPDNPYDPLAIQVLLPSGQRIGYVPRNKNEPVARLMDAGKLIFGRLESKTWDGFDNQWLKLGMKVYLKEV